MSTRSANKRERIRERDGELCWLCGRRMKFDNPRRLTGATLDHVTPKAAGGSNDIANLRLAHRVCNEKRGDAQWDRSPKGQDREAGLIVDEIPVGSEAGDAPNLRSSPPSQTG